MLRSFLVTAFEALKPGGTLLGINGGTNDLDSMPHFITYIQPEDPSALPIVKLSEERVKEFE